MEPPKIQADNISQTTDISSIGTLNSPSAATKLWKFPQPFSKSKRVRSKSNASKRSPSPMKSLFRHSNANLNKQQQHNIAKSSQDLSEIGHQSRISGNSQMGSHGKAGSVKYKSNNNLLKSTPESNFSISDEEREPNNPQKSPKLSRLNNLSPKKSVKESRKSLISSNLKKLKRVKSSFLGEKVDDPENGSGTERMTTSISTQFQNDLGLTTEEALKNPTKSLELILKRKSNLHHKNNFKEFLESEFSDENLEFYEAVDDLGDQNSISRSIDVDNHNFQKTCHEIINTFIVTASPREVNIDANTRNLILKERALGHISYESLGTAQKQIYNLMARDSYTRFLKSVYFRDKEIK